MPDLCQAASGAAIAPASAFAAHNRRTASGHRRLAARLLVGRSSSRPDVNALGVTGSGRWRTRRGGVAVWLESGSWCYRPVGRCVDPRLKPERPWPPTTAPRAAPGTGGGVRRISNRNVLSSEPSSSRSVNWLGATVRNSGPRSGSTTATTTFDRLGTSNTIPSRADPPAPTLTSSPIEVISTDRAYCPRAPPGTHRRHPRLSARG